MLLGNPPIARPMPQVRGAVSGGATTSATIGLKPDTSVGVGTSSAPYGPTNGYATLGAVTGFKGPAAGSLRRPTQWYVRVGGANTNGGSSTSLTPERSGSDGTTTNGSRTFQSASAAFTQADVGKGICIQSTNTCFAKIESVTNATTCIVTNPPNQTSGTLAWAIGGAWADARPFLNSNTNASATGGVQTGDTIYVGAGVYRAVGVVGTNVGVSFKPTGGSILDQEAYYNGVISIVGDVTGQYTGDAGMVMLTAYTTNDKTNPAGSATITLSSRSNMSFSNLVIVGGNTSPTCINSAAGTSQNVTFTDCAIMSNYARAIGIAATYPLQFNWLIDRCYIFNTQTADNSIALTCATGGLNDVALNLTLRNSVVIGSQNSGVISYGPSGAGVGKVGGTYVRSCLILGTRAINASGTGASLTLPSSIYDTIVYNPGGNVVAATTLGQIVEDWNLFISGSRSNVTQGPNSPSAAYAPLFHMGQERIWGALTRFFGEPMANSPWLGFGSEGGAPLVDLATRWRPAGTSTPSVSVGPYERGSTAVQGTSPVPTSGTHSWQGTGPWQQEFLMPVSAAADGFSIQVQRDASYSPPPSNPSNPTLEILGNNSIGVAYQKVADSGGAGSWNTLSLASFTPTGTGWVTIRLTSYDASGASVVSFAVAAPS